MALPVGVTTRVVTLGPGTTIEAGDALGVRATVKASRDLVWSATGTAVRSVEKVYENEAGLELEFELPVTDQAGWLLNGAVVDVTDGKQSHYYVITVEFFTAGGSRPVSAGVIGPISLPTGDGSPVDADKLIPATTTGGATISLPDSWSEAVALAQAAAAEAAAAVLDSDAFVASKVADPESLTGSALTATIGGVVNPAIAPLAPKASPAFTGVPTVNGQQIAPAATPYPYWRKKLAQVRAGTSDAKLLCLGDSTTYGYVAPPNNVPTPAIESYPSDLATMLRSYFAPAYVGLGIPKQQSGTSVDGRWSYGTGWAAAPGDGIGWAGQEVVKAAASSGNLVYTPGPSAGPCDIFDVYYVANGATPPFTIQATGGSVVTVTPGAQNGIFKATCTAGSAVDTNAVTIVTTAAAGSRRIVGVESYHSATRRIRVGNVGVGGSSSVGWASTSNAYKSLACIAAYAPDLTIIDLGLNDMPAPNTSPSTFVANLTAIIDACRLSGDVILMVPPPPQIGGSSNLTDGYAALIPTYAPLATSKATGLIDIASRWGSYAALNPLGYYSDTLHPSRIGYGDMAQAVMSLVRAI